MCYGQEIMKQKYWNQWVYDQHDRSITVFMLFNIAKLLTNVNLCKHGIILATIKQFIKQN